MSSELRFLMLGSVRGDSRFHCLESGIGVLLICWQKGYISEVKVIHQILSILRILNFHLFGWVGSCR